MRFGINKLLFAGVGLFLSGLLTAFAQQHPAPTQTQPISDKSKAKPELTLGEAIQLALKNNPIARAARGRVSAAAASAAGARLWENPTLDLAAEDWPLEGGSFPDTKQLIGLSQTIPFPGKKKLDGEIGRAGTRIADREASLQQLELIRDVKTAFYRVLSAERAVEVGNELLKVGGASAETTRKRVELGDVPRQDALRAEIQMERAAAELAAMQRDLSVARVTLAATIGCPDLRDASISGALSEMPKPELTNAVHHTLHGFANGGISRMPWLARHPSLRAAQAKVDRAHLEVKRARLEPYPDVTASVAGGVEGSTDRSLIQFGFSVPLPIINRGKAKKLETESQLTVAQAELVSAEQKLMRDWDEAARKFNAAAELVASYRERILPRAEEALRLLRSGFEQGKFGFIELEDIQRTVAEVRLAYQEKLLELNVAQAELEAFLEPSERLSATLNDSHEKEN